MKILLSYFFILLLVACGNNVNTDKSFVAKVEKSVLSVDDTERLMLTVTNKNYLLSDVVAEWVDRELLYLASVQAGFDNDETLKILVTDYKKDLLGKSFLDNHVAT